MNQKLLMFIPIVIAGLLISYGSLEYQGNTVQNESSSFVPMYLPISVAEAYEQSQVPTKTICNEEQIPFTEELIGAKIKTLKVIPEKYKINRVVDIDSVKGDVLVTYSFGACGEKNPTDPRKGGIVLKSSIITNTIFRNSTIIQLEGLEGQDRIDVLSELALKNLQSIDFDHDWYKDDRIVTINDHPALLTEPGYTTDRYTSFETGKLLYKERISYPGKIKFVDETFDNHYTLTGYFSANELIKMAESIN